MRALAALSLLLLPVASAAGAPAARPAAPGDGAIRPDARCDPLDHVRRTEGVPAGRLQRLDRLPPGTLDLAVSRMFAGCPESVTVAENFGTVEGPRAVKPRLRQPLPPRTRLLGR